MQYKSYFLGFLFSLIAFCSKSQGFFNQKGAMIKKCIEQIGLLKIQHTALNAGYTIINNAIQLTDGFKTGEFNLHDSYYKELSRVSDPVKNSPVVKQTLSLYHKIGLDRQAVSKKAKASELFKKVELDELNGIYNRIQEAADKDLDELKLLITGGILQMTEDARMKAINKINGSMKKRYSALTSLNSEVMTILKGRKEQKEQAAMLKQLYGQ